MLWHSEQKCILLYYIIYLILIISIFSTFFIGCNSNKDNAIPVKYIAYVGRFTDKNSKEQPDNRFDRMHEYMLNFYVDELNEKSYTGVMAATGLSYLSLLVSLGGTGTLILLP